MATKKRRGAVRSSALPTKRQLKSIYAALKGTPNVVGCFIGRRRVKNRASRELTVVCCVSQKLSLRAVAKADRIPRRIEWLKTRRRKAVVRTDVQECGPSGLSSAVVGPGDSTLAPMSTLGFVIEHPLYGLVATTAGHPFIKGMYGNELYEPPRPVTVVNSTAAGDQCECRVVKAVVSREADYALLQSSSVCQNLYQDELVLDGIHWARPEDVDRQLFVLTRSGFKTTRLRGVEGTVRIGSLERDGLLLTDKVTIGGDSGAALVDADFKLWGLLVGFFTTGTKKMSVFFPPSLVLALEQAEMA